MGHGLKDSKEKVSPGKSVHLVYKDKCGSDFKAKSCMALSGS